MNYQELRNCLYRGDLNNLAKEIVAENKNFLSILNLKVPHNRFLDVEFVVRIFALLINLKMDQKGDFFIEDYNGRLVTYINNFMKNYIKMPKEDVTELKRIFNELIEKVIAVFGVDKSFKDISENKPKVNKALADCILMSFSQYNIETLEKNKEKIQSALINLLRSDPKFKSSISLRTSDKDILNYRIDKWIKTLNNAL